ncbi:MAG: hypothetical protein ACQSGP_10165 [Frankia sp.]
MTAKLSMRENLEQFLKPHGTQYDDLRREVDDSFGEPRLVVAAGSVLQGFGNSASDVDLHAVVDDGRVTDFHVSFHDLGFSVDVNYVEETWIKDAATRPHTAPRTRDQWKDEQRRLTQLCRFTLGLPLAGRADWFTWREDAARRFADHAAWWWRAEALRFRTAAEILTTGNPLLAAQRYCDAGLAVLDCIAAQGDEAYVGTKWLGLKLHRIGRDDLLERYDRFLALPPRADDAGDYLSSAATDIAGLTADWGLPDDPVVCVAPAPGTEVWKVRNQHLVQRWGLYGLELSPDSAEEPVADAVTWSGRLSSLPDATRQLLLGGLLWLAVVEED